RVLDEVIAEGKGGILISGHVGNWEILGQAVAAAGYPVATIARPFYDPRITAWLQRWRSQRGLEVIWRSENTGKAILRVLRANRLMAFLIDRTPIPRAASCRFSGGPRSRRRFPRRWRFEPARRWCFAGTSAAPSAT